MGDGVGLLQSPLTRADAQAQANGGVAAPNDPVEACSVKNWTLEVRVRSAEKFWPKRVRIDISGGGHSKTGKVNMNGVTSRRRTFTGSGKKQYDVSASADHWVLVATEKVQLNDGATKKVVLTIKRSPWIAFKVVDETTNHAIKNVTFTIDWPGFGAQDVAADKGMKQVNGLPEDLRHAKLDAIEHPGAWMYVDRSSSGDPIE